MVYLFSIIPSYGFRISRNTIIGGLVIGGHFEKAKNLFEEAEASELAGTIYDGAVRGGNAEAFRSALNYTDLRSYFIDNSCRDLDCMKAYFELVPSAREDLQGFLDAVLRPLS